MQNMPHPLGKTRLVCLEVNLIRFLCKSCDIFPRRSTFLHISKGFAQNASIGLKGARNSKGYGRMATERSITLEMALGETIS